MNNYVYIISSLPVISQEWKGSADVSEKLISEIKGLLSKEDCKLVDFLMDSFDGDKLTEDFYRTAFSHKNKFIREYLRFDMNMRNAKVRYLNKALGRPADMDVMALDGGIFEEEAKMNEALAQKDILTREKAIDDLVWSKIEQITLQDYLDMKVILAFIAKLHIVDRWFKLDPQKGQEMFKSLVEEVRKPFEGLKNYE